MENNKYTLAGWLAIIQAVLFPIIFILGILEAGFSARYLGLSRPILGPSDLFMLIFTMIAVYTLFMFKKLLNERYEYHEINLLINISIIWAILFEVVGVSISLLALAYWPVDNLLFAVVLLIFFTASMVTIGIVDIFIAIKLLKLKENFGEYIKIFAYVTMIAGVCEVTVFLAPFSLLLIPVLAVVLALIFFKDKHVVEYV